MLYRYRVSNDEFLSLKALLGAAARRGHPDQEFLAIPLVPPLLVLYCAEWWRREYRGGVWRWTDILCSLSHRANGLTPLLRNEVVARGLRYWGQRTSRAGKRYLGAIALQGGFPMHLLAEVQGALPALIQSALKKAARLRTEYEETLAIVRAQAIALPASLRTDEMYDLIAVTVDTVLSLQSEYALADPETAVAELTRKFPSWREEFPLPLEDAAADALLQGLVKTAASTQITSGRSDLFLVRRQLVALDERSFSVAAELLCPSHASDGELAAALDIGVDDLPSQFVVDIQAAGHVQRVNARRRLGQTSYAISTARSRRTGPNAMVEHLMLPPEGVGGRRDLRPIPGGAELPDDLPWIFAGAESDHELIGVGGARTRSEEAIVALPAGAVLEEHAGSAPKLLGHCEITGFRRPILLVKASAVARLATGQRFPVRLRQLGAEAETLIWNGARFPYPTKPTLAFLGQPRAYVLRADGTRSVVPKDQLEFRPAGSASSGGVPAAVPGVYDVYWVQEGETHTRTRMAILPPNASITFRSANDITQGAVTIKGSGARYVTSDSDVVTRAEPIDTDAWRVSLRASSEPPDSVPILLTWSPESQGLQCDLPFPSSGVRFTDGLGRLLSNGSTLGVQRLAGVRIRVFDANPDSPQSYRVVPILEQSALSAAHGSPTEQPVDIPLPAGGSGALRLIDVQADIESLLNLAGHLDATVRVSVRNHVGELAYLRVKRYHGRIQVDLGDAIFVSESQNQEDFERLELAALSLANRDLPPVNLEQSNSQGVATGRWVLSELSESGAPWLLYPSPRSELLFRPAVYLTTGPVGEEPGVKPEDGFLRAAGLGDYAARQHAFSGLWQDMARSPHHDAWRTIERLWLELGHLPLSCLDVWRAGAQDPQAMVACAFQRWLEIDADSRVLLLRRFGSDLGAVWEIVSRRAWRDGFVALYDLCQSVVDDPEVARQLFFHFASESSEALASVAVGLQHILGMALRAASGQPNPKADLEQLGKLKRELYVGPEALVQTVLFHPSMAKKWPVGLYGVAFTAAVKAFDARGSTGFRRDEAQYFHLLDDFKASVINVPVLLGICAAAGVGMDFWRDPENLWALQEHRRLNPEWFTTAYGMGVRMAAAGGLIVDDATH